VPESSVKSTALNDRTNTQENTEAAEAAFLNKSTALNDRTDTQENTQAADLAALKKTHKKRMVSLKNLVARVLVGELKAKIARTEEKYDEHAFPLLAEERRKVQKAVKDFKDTNLDGAKGVAEADELRRTVQLYEAKVEELKGKVKWLEDTVVELEDELLNVEDDALEKNGVLETEIKELKEKLAFDTDSTMLDDDVVALLARADAEATESKSWRHQQDERIVLKAQKDERIVLKALRAKAEHEDLAGASARLPVQQGAARGGAAQDGEVQSGDMFEAQAQGGTTQIIIGTEQGAAGGRAAQDGDAFQRAAQAAKEPNVTSITVTADELAAVSSIQDEDDAKQQLEVEFKEDKWRDIRVVTTRQASRSYSIVVVR
jgi:hypothetical protein